MRVVLTVAFLSLLSAMTGCAPEGSSAYVSFNIPPDNDCQYSPTTELFTPIGQFDVAGSGDDAGFCLQSYFMHLLVNSSLKSNARDSTGRAEPNVLQVTEADVRLMDKNKGTLNFLKSDNKTPDPARPNPFRVQTANSLRPSSSSDPSTGVVAIEAIPKSYAPTLGAKFNGDNILIEVQIYGTTTGDVDIDFRSFVYPVSICKGCLSKCLLSLGGEDTSTVYGDNCADNGAQDGRVCIDPNC